MSIHGSRRRFLKHGAVVGSGLLLPVFGLQSLQAADPVRMRAVWWGGQDRARRTNEAIQIFEKQRADLKIATESTAWVIAPVRESSLACARFATMYAARRVPVGASTGSAAPAPSLSVKTTGRSAIMCRPTLPSPGRRQTRRSMFETITLSRGSHCRLAGPPAGRRRRCKVAPTARTYLGVVAIICAIPATGASG
jgi:hypothetical protein